MRITVIKPETHRPKRWANVIVNMTDQHDIQSNIKSKYLAPAYTDKNRWSRFLQIQMPAVTWPTVTNTERSNAVACYRHDTCSRNLYQKLAPNRMQLCSVQVSCTRNFQTQPSELS